MFQPVSNKIDFPSAEREVLDFWQRHKTFEKSLDARKDAPPYVFYDGPPFATGLPHYGHLLAGTIKDIVPRYQTMRGKLVERRFGWDCHGLPIEALAQEALGINGAAQIREYGVAAFNEQCRSMVLRYVSEWRKTVTRMGRWVDFDNDYKTMEPSFMESIWWVFKQLWEQKRVYRSYRIMPYSWKLNTPLSNFEAGNNYKDVQDPAITCRCKITKAAKAEWGEAYLLIWTTTPWTLPSNLAICAGPDVDYVAARDVKEGVTYILAEARLAAYYKDLKDVEIVGRMKGAELAGVEYAPLFPYFAHHKAFRVVTDDFVTTTDGTGLVHCAPAYGEDDFRVCRAAGIDLVDPLDDSCAFTPVTPEYAGMFCKDADKLIIRRLKDEGKLVHQSTIVHAYPFCDRTDTPLIYRAIEAWYVRIEDVREDLVRNNDSVGWTPEYVGDKRFGNWLREAKDWNISRNRFWGSCIPVWVNEEDNTDMICVGSIAELETLSGEKVTDLHKHFVDAIVFRKDGKTYRRTPEVLDCWFESGAMPYAQQHYPFTRKDGLDTFFPADFIAEGLDQTRGWFYTLLVLGTLLFEKSPYRNVIVNGLILAEDGKKMSKRLKNYPDPSHILETCGADALRLYMIYSPVVHAENLRFSENGVRQIMRDLFIPLWNAYSFFVTYANVDGFHDDAVALTDSPNVLDRWIISSLETLIGKITAAMDGYNLQHAVRPLVLFVEDLTNWYIRRSRRRFWKSQNDDDKLHAYRTLRYVLVQFSQVAAPFVPFITESIYRNLRGVKDRESVHLCDFPQPTPSATDIQLEARMAMTQTIVRLGRQLRIENDLKIRQPLAKLYVVSSRPDVLAMIAGFEDLITDELNIKTLVTGSDESALADLTLKADFRKLGPRFGAKMKAAAAAIAALPGGKALTLATGGSVALQLDGETFEITADDVAIQRAPKAGLIVATEGDVLVALETIITTELATEGFARELVSQIQNMRKDNRFVVVQQIRVTVYTDDKFAVNAILAHVSYISNETLIAPNATPAHRGHITIHPFANKSEHACDVVLNGHQCAIEISLSGNVSIPNSQPLFIEEI